MIWLVVYSVLLQFPNYYVWIQRILPVSVARNLKILLNKNIENLKSLQFDYNLMKMIKMKIQGNNLVVAEANKNKTVVIL